MEKRINTKLEQYITNFKNNICDKIKKQLINDTDIQNELLSYVYDYERIILTKEDFTKRKRIKNAIPTTNRCLAKRANNEQCTRRKKNNCDYCGTHEKARPHGLIEPNNNNNNNVAQYKKVEVIAREIMGIVYYIDENNNVYDTEDIMNNIENPRIIAQCSISSTGNYTIDSFDI